MKKAMMVFLMVLVCWYEVDLYTENGKTLEIVNIYCDKYNGEVFLMEEPENDE